MKTFAFLVMASAWLCWWFLPRETVSRVLQFIVFGLLGTLFTLAGGFQYWWDSGMRPGDKSAFVLVCGLLTLASQWQAILRALFEGEGGTEWPDSRRRR